jgi:ankyrin repeat protein
MLGLLSFSTLSIAMLVSASDTDSSTRLADEAKNGHVAKVHALLHEYVDVNATQGDGMTALHWAAYNDDVEMAELFLGAKANFEARTRVGGLTPLLLASRNGSAALLEALLEAGANANHASATGASALMSAAMTGRVDAVQVLLDHEADVNARERAHGQTPLMFAAWENRPEIIKMLMAVGAHPELASTVLPLNEQRYTEDGMPRKGRGSQQSGGNSAMGGMTALLFAARDGHIEAVTALLDGGANIDHVSGGDASSPIVIAIANGHYTLGQYLLDRGADPNVANLDGVAPLYATVNMRYAPVSWAPNPRIDQEVVDSLELMQALLEAGAEPNAQIARKLWFSPTSHDRGWIDQAGATPFWRAAMSTDVAAMQVLVAAGADPNLKTDGGATPLMVASGLGWIGNFSQNPPDSWVEAVEYCLELENDINAVDKDGFTALHGAASRGDNEIVQLLIDRGARVDFVNEDGNSPADMAFGPSRFFIPKPETVDLLVGLGAPFLDNCRSDQCVDGKFLGGAVTK